MSPPFRRADDEQTESLRHPQATANAHPAQHYMLAASRFAHYLKAMMCYKIGSFMTAGNVNALLNRWIASYVLLDDEAGQESKARYPLRDAQVDVTEIPGKPGAYKATVFLGRISNWTN